MSVTLNLIWGNSPQPPNQQIRIDKAVDLVLVFKADRPRDITSWTLTFSLAPALGDAASFTKTVGSGIALTDAGRGTITVTIADSDLSGLTVSQALADNKGYVWDLQRTNAGSEFVLAKGELILGEDAG